MSSHSDQFLTAAAGGDTTTKSILKSSRTNTSGKKKKENSSKKAVTFPNKDGKISPKLGPIKELVERQPVKDFQSSLFTIAQQSLDFLSHEQNKSEALAKLAGEEGYFPTSIRFKCDLLIHKDLKTDQASIDEDVLWKQNILDCQNELASQIKKQGGRNLAAMKIANRKTIVRELIKLGAVMSEHLKITHSLHLSTTNRDVISKGALMNFVRSIPLINDFSSGTNDKTAWENDFNRFFKILFESNLEMNKCLEMVCDESESDIQNRSFSFLLHSSQHRRQNEEEKYRDTYNKKQLPPAPTATSAIPNGTAPLLASGMPITPMNTAPSPGQGPTPNQTNIVPFKIMYEWDGQAFIPSLQMTPKENGQQPQKEGGAPPLLLLSPVEEWKKMTRETTELIVGIGDGTVEENESRSENLKLCDYVCFWMAETFPLLLTLPFTIIKKQSIQNKANAALRGLCNNQKAHTLAQNVEDKIDENAQHHQLTIGRSELENLIQSTVDQRVLTGTKKDAGDRNAGSLHRAGTNGDEQRQTPPNKKRKIVRTNSEEQTGRSKKNIRNPYDKGKKRNEGTKTPQQSHGKHDYRRGTSESHRKERQQQGRGRGRGRGRHSQRGRGGRGPR